MREIERTNRFKKDFKKIAKTGKHELGDLLGVIKKLANDIALPEKCQDHPLSGTWKDYRDCHVRPDWVLIYKLDPGKLILVRTGTHSELFE